jgi:hypothetical protein
LTRNAFEDGVKFRTGAGVFQQRVICTEPPILRVKDRHEPIKINTLR